MISLLASFEFSIGEHAEKVLYFLKLIYPISLLMLAFFLLGIYFAYLFWKRFAKRLHRSYEENRSAIERMSSLTADQDALLVSIESQFDKERDEWAAKVDERDRELEAFAKRLSEADSNSMNLQTALNERGTALREFEEKFNSVVQHKDSEIEQLGIELSKTDALRKELSEKTHLVAELRGDEREKNNLRKSLDQLEEILIDREQQVKELREKLGLR